jgi:hypothetical protein
VQGGGQAAVEIAWDVAESVPAPVTENATLPLNADVAHNRAVTMEVLDPEGIVLGSAVRTSELSLNGAVTIVFMGAAPHPPPSSSTGKE